MKYLLDTNICIYIIKKKPLSILEQLKKTTIEDIGISTITLAELEYGVAKSQHIEKNQKALTAFLSPFEICPFDDMAAEVYGKLRATLERQGTPIGSMDLMIAAHALSLRLTLVTHNTREFNRVKNLNVETWL